MDWLGRGGKIASAAMDARGRATRQMAIDSFRNIARLDIHAPEATDEDVDAIANVLKTASEPLSIVDLANTLKWDADRLSAALARGSERGALVLSRFGERTFVGPPATTAPPSF